MNFKNNFIRCCCYYVVVLFSCNSSSSSRRFGCTAFIPPIPLSRQGNIAKTRHKYNQAQDSLKKTFFVVVTKNASNDNKATDQKISEASNNNDKNSKRQEASKEDMLFEPKETMSVIGGQAFIAGVSVLIASIARIPNHGLGTGISLSQKALLQGTLFTLPLIGADIVLDMARNRFPALNNIKISCQQMAIDLLGAKFKPLIAIVAAIILGSVTGFGEEILFRSVLQYKLESFFGGGLALTISSFMYGLLHSFTPLNTLIASLFGAYFGALYTLTNKNVAVPMICHALHDIVQILYAHWTVSKLTAEEQIRLAEAS